MSKIKMKFIFRVALFHDNRPLFKTPRSILFHSFRQKNIGKVDLILFLTETSSSPKFIKSSQKIRILILNHVFCIMFVVKYLYYHIYLKFTL